MRPSKGTTQDQLGVVIESFDFRETSEMIQLRHDILLAKTVEEVLPLYRQYDRLGREVVETACDSYGDATLWLNLLKTRVWRAWGDNDRYIESLKVCGIQAANMGRNDIGFSIRELLKRALVDKEEVELLLSAGSGVLNSLDLLTLKRLPLDYALGNIYPMLFGAGIDADNFLRNIGMEIDL